MRLVRAAEADLAAELDRLSARLGPDAGMISPESERKTVEVFGRPLTPQEVVRRIVAQVRERGDAAVAEYAEKLDGVALAPERFRVTREEIESAYASVPDALKESLARAEDNIRAFQEHIKPRAPRRLKNAEGGEICPRLQPLERVGVCVPGGRASYPSTVLMCAVPARVAGVREVAMVTPCGPDGTVRPETLAAAYLAGVKEIYRVGGAHAVAALAYGTQTIPRVEKIVGPGNIFVTLAKREVYGQVDLDMLAGPSDVLIIADGSADPRFAAADLLSQAEHDPAAAVLLTPDEAVALRTLEEVERQVAALGRAKAARGCLERYGLIGVTRSLEEALALANRFAPEHLELLVEDPEAWAQQVRAAGTVFLGPYTPEPVGDYLAGPSHVLPTGGTARFFSGLSVHDFLRRSAVIAYSERALRRVRADVERLARAEGLDGHARSISIRFESRP